MIFEQGSKESVESFCLAACLFVCLRAVSLVVTAVLKLIGSTQLLAAQRFATLMNDT